MAAQNTLQAARGSLDVPDIGPLLDNLEGNIDDLESALQPLVESALSETTSKLPVLDKAKLYILVTYTIESILFCMYKAPLLGHPRYNQRILPIAIADSIYKPTSVSMVSMLKSMPSTANSRAPSSTSKRLERPRSPKQNRR